MKPYLGFGTGENGPDRFSVVLFFIQAKDIEGALKLLNKMAWEYWDAPVVESLTLLPPGNIPSEWLALFTGEEKDGMIDYTIQATTLAEMVA